MRNLLLVGAALLVLLGVGGYLMFYSPKAKTTRVTVAGVSEAQLSPDTAVVTLSVVTNGAQALNAQQDNAAKSEAVKKAIEAVLGCEQRGRHQVCGRRCEPGPRGGPRQGNEPGDGQSRSYGKGPERASYSRGGKRGGRDAGPWGRW